MIQEAKQLLYQLLKSHNVCPSHGYGHALRVLEITQQALDASENPPPNRQDILLAALLHDADDRKLFGQNSNNTQNILNQIGVNEVRAKSIHQMINLVSFSKNQDKLNNNISIFSYYPRYSDRLEASGKIGIVRSYTYGKGKGRKVCVEETPKPLSKQQLEETIRGRDENYRKTGQSLSMIDHFYDKILHITCPQELNNIKFYKEQFDRRKQQVEDFILEYTNKNFQGLEETLQKMQMEFKGVVN